jgi:murein DD-endopeptidase MepM/ murein hydrolase activator NlpD
LPILCTRQLAADDFWIPTNGPDLTGTFGVHDLGFNNADAILAPVNSGSCFAPDALGVLRSDDNGTSWFPINNGLTTTNVKSLTVTPTGVIFAGTRNGVFVSPDDGATWFPTPLNHTDISVLTSTQDSVYAADGCFCTGVYRSRDGGASWQPLNNGLQPCINALVVNAVGHIFAGSGVSGVYRSTNDGLSWVSASNGMTSGNVASLVLNSHGHLFVGTANAGLFRSTNGADNWTTINVGPPNLNVYTIAIDRLDTILVGTDAHGVSLSRDNGETWTIVNTGLEIFGTITALAFNSNDVAFAAHRGRVYRSSSSTTALLSFPLAARTPSTTTISAVFDHHMTTGANCPDDVVVAYTGEEGRREFGVSNWSTGADPSCSPPGGQLHGFQNAEQGDFEINGHYVGDPIEGRGFLFYDGHTGFDFPAADGTDVYAAAPGLAMIVGGPNDEVVIDHGDGHTTHYLHLSDFEDGEPGEADIDGKTVARGQKLGEVGEGHLHFTVKRGGIRTDPYGWSGPGSDPYTDALNLYLWNDRPPCFPRLEAGVIVCTAAIFADGFESGTTSAWSSASP